MKKVILSMPFYSKDRFEADFQDLVELNYGIRLVEVRFDYSEEEITEALIMWIIESIHSQQMKVIFTYKCQEWEDNTNISKIHNLISHKPDYIDLDINIIASVLTELADFAIENEVAIVYSYHNWEETPPIHFISDLCEFFIQMLPQFSSNTRHILKMVFMATKPEDSTVIMEFCKRYGDQGFNLISFCMGDLGKMSRVQSIANGCAYAYAFIGDQTAPGQIHVSEIMKIL